MVRLGLYELLPSTGGGGSRTEFQHQRRHPLATQEHGWDVEDIVEADREAEEDEEED
jgi:hypothetical protein